MANLLSGLGVGAAVVVGFVGARVVVVVGVVVVVVVVFGVGASVVVVVTLGPFGPTGGSTETEKKSYLC